MHCVIYKSRSRQDTYLYLEREGDFSRVPQGLLQLVGQLDRVMDLELIPERKLAQADVEQVMGLLRDCGYYLQLPPKPLGR